MCKRVFSYGSNMNHSHFHQWVNQFSEHLNIKSKSNVGVLNRYKLVWNYYSSVWGCGVANIIPALESKVVGVLYSIDAGALDILDSKEGPPRANYSRHKVTVTTEAGDEVDAWVYYAEDNRNGATNIWPTRKYLNLIISGAKYHQLPTDYIAKLENTPTID